TTLSTAFALELSDSQAKDKILLVSVEPNGGLSDLVKKKLTDKPTKLAGKGNGGLWAAELDQDALGRAWNEKYRVALKASAVKGAILDEADVAKLLDASTTHFGETAAMFHLLDLLDSKEFDRIVVDGLGAAHTLRVLDAPTQLRRFIALVR